MAKKEKILNTYVVYCRVCVFPSLDKNEPEGGFQKCRLDIKAENPEEACKLAEIEINKLYPHRVKDTDRIKKIAKSLGKNKGEFIRVDGYESEGCC